MFWWLQPKVCEEDVQILETREGSTVFVQTDRVRWNLEVAVEKRERTRIWKRGNKIVGTKKETEYGVVGDASFLGLRLQSGFWIDFREVKLPAVQVTNNKGKRIFIDQYAIQNIFIPSDLKSEYIFTKYAKEQLQKIDNQVLARLGL